ncbi:MAG: sodium/proline symporter [Armatimonadetes bacterium]|nr:sodium/proline symporter [Armatimonadota bacterium]
MWTDPKFLAFAGYFLLMVGIGLYTMKFSSKGVNAFFIGDRKLSKYVVALSAVVSGRSAWTILALSGLAYLMGPSAFWWVTGFIVSEMLLFFFFAGKMRRFSEKRDCITVPDFLAARFGDKSGKLRVVCLVIILMFILPYIGAQFMAGGSALSESFQSGALTIGTSQGILITAGIVFLYTFLGGFLAVSLTDTIQAFFMLFALLVLPALVIADIGGFQAMQAILEVIDPKFIDPLAIAGGMAIGGVALGLGSVGNPHITTRYMAIKDPEGLRVAGVVGTVWNTLMCWGSIFVGLAGRAASQHNPALVLADHESVFPVLVNEYLPGPLAGIVLAAVFAAIMSTADSQLLVAAAAVVRDFYQKVLKRSTEIAPHVLAVMARGIIVVLVGIALAIGMTAGESLHSLVILAWSGPGSAIGPIALLAVFWKRTTWAGAIAGMVTGAVIVLFWAYSHLLGIGVMVDGELVSLKAGLIAELVPGFFGALIVAVVVSLKTRPPENADELVADFS